MSHKHTVTRNNITLALRNFKIIRGDNKDKEYPSIEVTESNLQHVTQWLGGSVVASIIQTFVKRASQELWLDNVTEDGQVNVAKFLHELGELTSASMKLADLKDRYDELVAKQGLLVEQLDNEPTIEVLTQIKELGTAIKVVKAQMDAKSRKNKPEVAAEASVAV